MKKLFLFLILSFFSAQGLAAGCPDGSEPVKSISADGTYFVYKCSSSDQSNGSANSSTLSNNTSSVWKDNGVSTNVAMQLSRVGVNTEVNWTGMRYGADRFTAFDRGGGDLPRVSNRNSDVEQVFGDGFSHFVYIVAFNRLFTQECQLKNKY